MLLGFKRRFAPFVEDGSKTHTIRAERKNIPRVGQTCHCYVDPRQKTMRLLGRWPCVKVERIEIRLDKFLPSGIWRPTIRIEGDLLSPDECNALAWRDGFRSSSLEASFQEMTKYWLTLHGTNAFPFIGHIIHWNYEEPVR